MISYLVKRLVWCVSLMLLMSLATFVIFFVVPPDRVQVGRRQETTRASIQNAAGVGDGPVPVQWAEYVWHAVRHQTLGRSARSALPVTDILVAAVPVTASLLVGGTLLFLLIATPVGILSALRPRSLLDRCAMVFVFVGVAAHPAWIGLILSYFVGYKWKVTPVSQYCDFFHPSTQCGGAVQWAYHLLLPWITFALLFAALYARMIRASVLESLQEDYVRTARAKGGSGAHVLRTHILRNAALPVVMMLGMDVGLAFGGSVFVETVFGLPGMGKTLVTALSQRDLPVLLGVITVVTAAIAVLTLIADICYFALDPRVRLTSATADFGDEPSRPKLDRRKRLAGRLVGPEPYSQRSTAAS
jgi:peptide/nickel transport system permease protein